MPSVEPGLSYFFLLWLVFIVSWHGPGGGDIEVR
jgi:hypothetical protein